MFRKIIILLFVLRVIFFSNPLNIYAQQNNIECSNRYLTLINPIRSRQLWVDNSLGPINSQYNLIVNNNFNATWLLQNDVLFDPELLNTIKSFNSYQELGLLLEVSDKLATDSKVIYPPFVPWYNPKAVFLSGYTQSERRLLIDKMFENFFQTFGYYPKSVGAWWIDSYSLNYLKEKYGIKSALIVADQQNTDNYGVWGQWWSVPYYPSKANILTPASSLSNKQPVVILQWAQRDPILAYGANYHSSYSLQANDYTLLGKDINYFKDLVNVYLDCQNEIGQITIGLETGMESIRSLPEYERQLQYLKTLNFLHPVTMTQFAEKYSKIYPEFQKQSVLSYQGYIWKLQTSSRDNDKLNEHITYQQNISFQDYFIPSQSNFLDRELPINKNLNIEESLPNIYIIAFIFWSAFLFVKRKIKLLFISIFFILSAYGLILRSTTQFGWHVFYGPVIENLALIQFILVFLGFGLLFLIDHFLKVYEKKYLYLIPLVFGLDIIFHSLRFSFISNKYFLGIMTNELHFLGTGFEKPFNLSLVNQDFPAYQALALLHFDYNLIWQNIWLSVIVFPLAHILLAILLWYFIKFMPHKIKTLFIIILVILFTMYLFNIWQANPRAAIISATIKQ